MSSAKYQNAASIYNYLSDMRHGNLGTAAEHHYVHMCSAYNFHSTEKRRSLLFLKSVIVSTEPCPEEGVI